MNHIWSHFKLSYGTAYFCQRLLSAPNHSKLPLMMTNKSLTFAMKAAWLLINYISLTSASPASEARSDAFGLVEFARAIPALQNVAGAYHQQRHKTYQSTYHNRTTYHHHSIWRFFVDDSNSTQLHWYFSATSMVLFLRRDMRDHFYWRGISASCRDKFERAKFTRRNSTRIHPSWRIDKPGYVLLLHIRRHSAKHLETVETRETVPLCQ